MELDKGDNLKLSIFGVYEPVETDLVKSVVKAGDCALDIGANIGYYALLLSRLVGNQGRVYAFEPQKGNYAILERNVRRNALSNVTLSQTAVGAESGSANLFLSPSNPGDHHLFDVSSEVGVQTQTTDVVSLDDYLEPRTRVDFIKMDIQGAEPAAFAGMRRTLERQRDVKILSEFWPSGMERAGFDAGEFLDGLTDLGFTYRHVDQRAKRLMPCSRSELLETQWIVEKSTNLFLSRD